MKDQPKADVSPDPAGDAIKKWEADNVEFRDQFAALQALSARLDACEREHSELKTKSAEAFSKVASYLSDLKKRTDVLEAQMRHIMPVTDLSGSVPIIRPK
jgi:chromosome segregation ATPase